LSNSFYKKKDEKGKKEIIGDFIYVIVDQVANSKHAPKITGMILD